MDEAKSMWKTSMLRRFIVDDLKFFTSNTYYIIKWQVGIPLKYLR